MDKNINQLWSELEGMIRREPQKSILLAFAGGFFLCLLPLGKVLGTFVRVLFARCRPIFRVALLQHGRTPISELARDQLQRGPQADGLSYRGPIEVLHRS